jgi:hydroxylamine reductase
MITSSLRRTCTFGLANRLVYRTASTQAGKTTKTGPVTRGVRHEFSGYLATESQTFEMFCRQCEQAKDGVGCTSVGICGKSPETSAVQDTLVHVIKSVSTYCVAARRADLAGDLEEANKWTLQATFSTLTNVNFSERSIVEFIEKGIIIKDNIENMLLSTGYDIPIDDSTYPHPKMSFKELEDFGVGVGVLKRQAKICDDTKFSLSEIATYGMKGTCAYAGHCARLGVLNEEVMASLHEVWSSLHRDDSDVKDLVATVLRVGEINAKVLSLLDEAHTTNYGVPKPTKVLSTAVKGKGILVSGHDLTDLMALLKQTEGTGVNVYTHGEMLPAHSYPMFHSFPHLVGNYGTAWQKQKVEFQAFPGPVVLTSNCILHPRRQYKNRVYTTNEVAVDGVHHIENQDFAPVIDQALGMTGFERSIEPKHYKEVGYNHRAVLPLTEQIVKAVKSGSLSRIFLIGGCDGTEWSRSYFTDLATETPDDSIILTLGCAKNRVINSDQLLDAKLSNGLPRVMDMGQCNDSYSAIVLVQELARSLGCDTNDLPVSIALSFMEQKSVAVLLTLLNLGVKNIRIGPTPPAFMSKDVWSMLQNKYNLMATGDVETDLKDMIEGR